MQRAVDDEVVRAIILVVVTDFDLALAEVDPNGLVRAAQAHQDATPELARKRGGAAARRAPRARR